MIVATSHSVEGRAISEYLGIVSAAQVMVLQGVDKTVQRSWQNGVDGVTESLAEQAQALGADAVIGIQYQAFGSYICATGTAVQFAR